jgi:chemotaxis protein CheC
MEINNKAKEELAKISEMSSKIAADALSKMINASVKVEFPNMTLKPMEELSSLNENMLLSACEVNGDVNGDILMAFMKEKGLPLLDMVMYQQIGTIKEVDSHVQSIFNELTNIIGGTYVSSLANYLSFIILPAPPVYLGDPGKINTVLLDKYKNNEGAILLIKTILSVDTTTIEGSFFLVLNNESLKTILTLLSNSAQTN